MSSQGFRLSSSQFLRYVYIASTLLIILALIPSTQKFKYDFELGKPWAYEDFLAPFSFPVLKSEAEVAEEKERVKVEFEPYYVKNKTQREFAINAFLQSLDDNIGQFGDEAAKRDAYIAAGKSIINQLYDKGIIDLEPIHRDNENLTRIQLLDNKLAVRAKLISFYQRQEIKDAVQKKAESFTGLDPILLRNSVNYGLHPDIIYESDISESKLAEEVNAINRNIGLVEAGELIISKGLTVTADEYKKLSSLREQYQELVKSDGRNIHLLGYLLLVLIIFIIYIGYLQLFQIELLKKNRRLLLLLINIVLFVFLSRYVSQHASLNIYIVPFTVIPIIVLAFFDYKLALITHIVVILIVGSFVPVNAAEFIVIQLIAGFVSIITMVRMQYLSQFFIAALYIQLGYIVSFSAFYLIEINSLAEINWIDYLWLIGNFMLSLLAFPLIYAYEKMFGFVSDITLVELADVNKKILRKLSVNAPGTFQHSLQVANLSESVINQIGGRALLTRVGALYHDIGKMENPEYFIENQKFMENPHNALSDEESARIIIDHVNKGVKLARSYGLPSVIVEFIQTHHGTSRVEYFYRNYLKKVSADQVDETKFRYPGPRPFSREMAVVMICDSVEAATRSLRDKTQESLTLMIDGIIDNKINDKQLQNAPITLQEIETMRTLLKELTNSMYHVRIQYPEEGKKMLDN